MQIDSIRPSRIQNRVYLRLSNGLLLPFFIDDVVLLKLSSHQEINEQQYKSLLETSLNYLSLEYALRQIGISPKNEKILTQKLKIYLDRAVFKYKIDKNEINFKSIIDNCVSKLKEKNLLQNSEYIRFFIKKHKNKSKRELIYLLEHQGIDPNTIPTDILDELGDIEKIKKILIKKNVNRTNLTDFSYKNKLIASLYRKGFSLTDIKNAIDELVYSR